MPNPRPMSIVKLIDHTNPDAAVFDLQADDQFVYLGEIAQDPTKCIVLGLRCGKRIHYLSPSLFEEVDPSDFI
jgi:hypothetical protein